MPDVRPLTALRYAVDRTGGNLSPVLAPPYDVLKQADKDTLLTHSPLNVVGIDLPYLPPKSAGPPEVYKVAARQLNEWLENGVLIRDIRPALYPYHQSFTHQGSRLTRRMFIARVRLQFFSEGAILPHERTFGGPKEDRLALLKATRCQLSPIFGLYADPNEEIGRAFAATVSRKPDAFGTMQEVENSLWVVSDHPVIDGVTTYLRTQRLYIADGHHRYGTALMYRDFLATQQGGSLPEDHPAHYVMFVLASMDDPGCLILPYHRVLAPIGIERLLSAWREGVARTVHAEADLTLMDGKTGAETPLRFTNRKVLRALEPNEVGPWYDLDYAYLHRYLMDELLTENTGNRAPKVHYVKSADEARAVARDESGVALLTRATSMAQLRAVSEAGGLMPQKSTYFYPKLATGMALYPLA